MVEGAIQVGVIEVRGMTCDECVKKLQAALEKVPGVMGEGGDGALSGAVKIDLKKGEAQVRYDPAKVSMVKFVQVVNSTGYRAVGFRRGK